MPSLEGTKLKFVTGPRLAHEHGENRAQKDDLMAEPENLTPPLQPCKKQLVFLIWEVLAVRGSEPQLQPRGDRHGRFPEEAQMEVTSEPGPNQGDI